MHQPASYPSQFSHESASPLFEPSACDLFEVFGRAVDQGAAETFAAGLSLRLHFDPDLCELRMADAETAGRLARATLSAMVRMTRAGQVSVCAGLSDDSDDVILTVSSQYQHSAPDADMFALAAERARQLGGRLSIAGDGGDITLSVRFAAPRAPASLGGPGRPDGWRAPLVLVEAAEFEAVQAGDDTQEDQHSKDRDHGHSVSAIVRTA